MSEHKGDTFLRWALIGLPLAGVVLFGAVGATPVPGLEFRPDFRHILVTATATLCALVLLARRGEREELGWWALVVAPYPLLCVVQLVPLPWAAREALNPASAELYAKAWPLGAAPALAPLTVDALATREAALLALCALGAFLAARALWGSSRSRQNALLLGVALFGALQALYGLYEWVAGDPFVLWQPKEHGLTNATGTLINRNHYALLLYLCMGAALTLLLRLGPLRFAGEGRRGLERVGLLVAAALMLAGVAASASRAGAAGALLVLAATMPFLWRQGRGARVASVVLATLVAAPVLVVALPVLAERYSAVLTQWGAASGRGAVLRASGALIGDMAWTGSGAGTFALVFPPYRPPEIGRGMNFAHNDYLEALIELGVPGLLAALLPIAAWGWCFVRARSRERGGWMQEAPFVAALVAVALHALVDFSLKIPALLLLVALLVGAMAPQARRGLRVLPMALGVTLVVVAGIAASHALGRWPPLAPRFATLHLPDVVHAQASEAQGREALELERRARTLRPMSAWYALAQAKRASGEGEADLARRSAADVELLDPWDPRKRLELMAIALELGDERAALRHGVVALALDPAQGQGSRGVFTQLERAGLEPTLLATQLDQAPPLEEGTLPGLLRTAMRAGAWELAEALVPEPLDTGSESCAAALEIARLLDRRKERDAALAHVASCEDFLAGDDAKRGRLALWLARRRALLGEHQLALEHLARVPEGPSRMRGALDLARARGDWPAVVRHAWAIIDDQEHPPSESVVLWALHRMGEANARRGEIEAAIRNYEAIVRADPLDTRAEQYLSSLRAGYSPFE